MENKNDFTYTGLLNSNLDYSNFDGNFTDMAPPSTCRTQHTVATQPNGGYGNTYMPRYNTTSPQITTQQYAGGQYTRPTVPTMIGSLHFRRNQHPSVTANAGGTITSAALDYTPAYDYKTRAVFAMNHGHSEEVMRIYDQSVADMLRGTPSYMTPPLSQNQSFGTIPQPQPPTPSQLWRELPRQQPPPPLPAPPQPDPAQKAQPQQTAQDPKQVQKRASPSKANHIRCKMDRRKWHPITEGKKWFCMRDWYVDEESGEKEKKKKKPKSGCRLRDLKAGERPDEAPVQNGEAPIQDAKRGRTQEGPIELDIEEDDDGRVIKCQKRSHRRERQHSTLDDATATAQRTALPPSPPRRSQPPPPQQSPHPQQSQPQAPQHGGEYDAGELRAPAQDPPSAPQQVETYVPIGPSDEPLRELQCGTGALPAEQTSTENIDALADLDAEIERLERELGISYGEQSVGEILGTSVEESTMESTDDYPGADFDTYLEPAMFEPEPEPVPVEDSWGWVDPRQGFNSAAKPVSYDEFLSGA